MSAQCVMEGWQRGGKEAERLLVYRVLIGPVRKLHLSSSSLSPSFRPRRCSVVEKEMSIYRIMIFYPCAPACTAPHHTAKR